MPRSAITKNKDTSGAKQTKRGFALSILAYRMHHVASLKSSVQKLSATPMQTLLTALVVAIALALPTTLLVALQNAQQVGNNLNATPQLSVYLNKRAKPQAIEAYINALKGHTDIQNVQYKTADQALNEFKQTAGMAGVLSALDENPLPPTLIIKPAAAALTPTVLSKLADELEASALVDDVVFDMGWVRKLIEIMSLLEAIVFALAAMLGCGILLAIGNTTRLEIENRRAEIVVTKLVGGTNAFVRRPLLYTGLLYGILGAVLAAIIVFVVLLVIAGPVERLALAYESNFTLTGMGLQWLIILVGLGGFLGLSGAWLAVSRQLSQIEP